MERAMSETENRITPVYLQRFLKKPPLLLANFHYDDVLDFLKVGIVDRFQPDEVIMQDDEIVNTAFLVAEGSVSVWKEGIHLTTLEAGDFLGEAFLYSKYNRMAKVTAAGHCILLRYERQEVLNFFRKKPEKLFNIFTRNIIEIQQRKINDMNFMLLRLKQRILNDTGKLP